MFTPARRDPAPPGDIARGLVRIRDDIRTIEIFTQLGQATYDIEIDRILTHRQFTDWVWQLQNKGWMTGQHFSDLFECLSEYIYRQWSVGPQKFYEVDGAIQQGLDKV
jgi:hypothetical protein